MTTYVYRKLVNIDRYWKSIKFDKIEGRSLFTHKMKAYMPIRISAKIFIAGPANQT